MDNKINSYETADILGKSGLELVVKVYDGAIVNLEGAMSHYRGENYQAGYEAMEKAKKFIVHLYTTLDKEKGGDIAENLGRLYAFVIEQINLIQATKDKEAIAASIKIMRNLREGWMMLDQEMKNKARPAVSTMTSPSPKSVSMSI